MALTRSQNMARIKAKDTGPEQVLRRALWAAGLRYRKHARTPLGRPDVVFLGARVAVFIDGCFWHGCPHHYVRPRSRTDFWSAKLLENVDRDTRQTRGLEEAGWGVVRFWEHEVFEETEACVERVRALIDGQRATAVPEWRVFRVDPCDETGDIEKRWMRRLRFEDTTMYVVQRRNTAKWKRPA